MSDEVKEIVFAKENKNEHDLPKQELVECAGQSEILDSGHDAHELKKADLTSKRMRKKLLKKQKWLEHKPIKRAMERERTKRRKMEARLNNTILGPSRKKLKQAKMSTSKIKVNLVLDFSFTHLMSDKDLSNCLKQIGFCYGVNRRVDDPCQFYVTSFTGRAIEMMEKNDGYTNWDVYFREESWRDIFKKEDVVYLTSDSDNVLENIEDNKAYIIGGLVDHNAHKGLCLRTAEELGVHHARLPIPEYIDMKTRKVLTINHVFEIMVNVSNKMSWKDALIKVIPVRKGALDKETDKLEYNSNNNGHQIDENFCDENLLKSQDQIDEFKSSKVS